MTRNYIGFAPIKAGDGNYFWSVGNSYGTMQFAADQRILSVMGDALALSSFGLREGERAVYAYVDGSSVPFEQKGSVLSFPTVKVRSTLTIQTTKTQG